MLNIYGYKLRRQPLTRPNGCQPYVPPITPVPPQPQPAYVPYIPALPVKGTGVHTIVYDSVTNELKWEPVV